MGTYGSVRGESLRKKEEMKMKNAESLEAVHTHTHTHTHQFLFKGGIRLLDRESYVVTKESMALKTSALHQSYVNRADLLDSLESNV